VNENASPTPNAYVVARHYGLTEEMVFIINYYIKYRMGKVETGENEA